MLEQDSLPTALSDVRPIFSGVLLAMQNLNRQIEAQNRRLSHVLIAEIQKKCLYVGCHDVSIALEVIHDQLEIGRFSEALASLREAMRRFSLHRIDRLVHGTGDASC